MSKILRWTPLPWSTLRLSSSPCTKLRWVSESWVAKDLVELQAEYLKWGSKTLAPHIMKIFKNIIQQGFPTNWTVSLAIPLFKSGDVNNPSNSRTIMINPLFAKLFGSMLENRINKWAEEGDKHAKGQASFRPKHSMIDHDVNLSYIIEKVWEKKRKPFVDLSISKKLLTWSLEISFGIEWRNLGSYTS
jgi:hypothetical protein